MKREKSHDTDGGGAVGVGDELQKFHAHMSKPCKNILRLHALVRCGGKAGMNL